MFRMKLLLTTFLGLFGALLTLQHAQALDTSQIPLTEAIEIHMKPAIQLLLSPEDRQKFYATYYENVVNLEGFSIDKLLSMFGADKADNATCQMCNGVITLGRQLLTSAEAMTTLLGGLCHESTTYTRRVCLGTLEHVAGPLVWLFQHSPLHTEEICSVLIHHGCLDLLEFTGGNKSVWWELPLPAKRDFKPAPLVSDAKHKKVLHLTDIHLDLWYVPGSNATCNEPLCCRTTALDPKNTGHKAGFWAHVNGDCDIPVSFVADSLKQIAAEHPDIDAIFWTGDYVPHDIWNYTQEVNLLHINTVTKLIAASFPSAAVFPTLGNHETSPVNLYIPSQVTAKDPTQNMTWLYGTLANDYWARWLPDAAQKASFAHGGFFAKTLTPTWKVIVLNTNIGQVVIFWVVYDPMDPDGHLAWLIRELDAAEVAGQFVSLLGHIPPGGSLYNAWFHNYIRILDRYSHLLTGSYFGHTHHDEIMIIHNEAKVPFHVTYISGSLTTASYLNPSYTIFEMDARGFPLNSTAYMTDMDTANEQHKKDAAARPHWRAEYNALKSYRLPDMSPKSWDAFIQAAKEDLDLTYLYADHYHRHSLDYQMRYPWTATDVERLVQGVRRYPPFMKH